MKIAAIRVKKCIQWRYPRPKRTRIPCVGVISEIIDDGHSQVADTGQDHEEKEPEKPCKWID